jgi:hypothetical protein
MNDNVTNQKKLEQAEKLKENLQSYIKLLDKLIESNTKKDDKH